MVSWSPCPKRSTVPMRPVIPAATCTLPRAIAGGQSLRQSPIHALGAVVRRSLTNT